MKSGFFYSMIFMLSFSMMTLSCSSSDDNDQNPNDNSVIIGEISTTVQSGAWRISSFVDSGTNETDHFNGYNFTFSANGSLIASNGTTTNTGTWSITSDNSNSSDDIDFNIAFSSPDDFAELTEDWHIVSRTSTRLDLMHESGGNGGTDTLTFEMN